MTPNAQGRIAAQVEEEEVAAEDVVEAVEEEVREATGKAKTAMLRLTRTAKMRTTRTSMSPRLQPKTKRQRHRQRMPLSRAAADLRTSRVFIH
jgi:hypothetical protein